MKKILLPAVGCSALTCALSSPKIRFLMRASVVLCLSMVISLQLAAFKTNGQGLDSEITLQLNHTTLKEALRLLQNKTNIPMVYAPDLVEAYTDVSLSREKRTVRAILEIILKETDLSYVEQDNAIVLRRKVTADLGIIQNAISDIYPFSLIVSGKVTDATTAEPLPGVNVLVKGTNYGTTTDTQGKFTLDIIEDSPILVFSFIGFKSVEVIPNGQTSLSVVMQTDVTALREVQIVSTNYFSSTKEKSTMNIAKVDGKEIQRQPVTSLMNSVVGRMAGVEITADNGTAGIAPKIQIRGNNSIRPGGEGSYPLYVIDGVQIESRPIQTYNSGAFAPGFDPLGSINPADIESIEVLKDAAATAIYGSRGANGVVRITTKKAGYSSMTGFTLSAYTGVGVVGKEMNLLSTRHYMQMRHEALKNSGVANPGFLDFDLNGVWDTTRYTNFQKELLGHSAKITDFNAGLSGGSGLTNISINGGFHSEGTVYPGNCGMKRITTDLSLNHSSNDRKFSIAASVYYAWSNNKSFSDPSFVSTALSLPPVTPSLRDSIGNINFGEIELFPGFTFPSLNNPLTALLKTDQARSNSIISNMTLSYEIRAGLSIKNSLSLQYFGNSQINKLPISSYAPSQRQYYTGEATFSSNSRASLMIEPQLTYDKEIGHHQLSFILGGTWQKRNSTFQADHGYGYQADELLNSLKGSGSIYHAVDDYVQYKYAAVYARIGYHFSNKYLLDLTGRRDGSSRFGPGRKYGNFGAVSAGWIFSNEKLMKDNFMVLSFGKLRGSYGRTGNDQIPDYQYYNTYSPTTYPYQGGISLSPTSLFNPNYAWEVTTKKEIALELGLFQDRVFFEASWYSNRSSNQLINYRLPGTTGFESIVSNFPATIENTGFEIVVNTRNVNTNIVRWASSFNISAPRNKLVEFDNIENSPYAQIYKVGEPLSIRNLYTYRGIDPKNGSYMVLDKNEDGSVTPKDRSFTSATGQRYYGGISNTFNIKSFEISFLLQFSKARVFGFITHPVPGVISNQPSKVMSRWQTEGDITTEPAFSTGENISYFQNYVVFSDKNTAVVGFLRLKTASLTYRLPPGYISRIGFSDAQVYIQGQNLLTFTSFDDALDPETLNSLPPLRMVTLGVQFKL